MNIQPDSPFFLYTKDGVKFFLLNGIIEEYALLQEIPRPKDTGNISVSMIPYSQVKERGFVTAENDEKIITLICEEIQEVTAKDVFPETCPPICVIKESYHYNCSEKQFAARVRAIIHDEIQNGEGSNFLLSRKLRGKIKDFSTDKALTILKHLVANEFGAYWNFCFYDGKRYFIGSSPERHLSYCQNEVLMNPICGTFPKSQLLSKKALLEFLRDTKEINELFQVLDEELKMMAKICDSGGAVEGPYLKEMRSVIHTEYLLRGVSSMDKMDAFKMSMFAATMIGSPLENAARIIHKYETETRGYYSSAALLLDLDENGNERLDSAITIRTAEIAANGDFILQAGASIVRDSDPEKESVEVNVKYEGLLKAFTEESVGQPILGKYIDEEVSRTLEERNRMLSRFWMEPQSHPKSVPLWSDELPPIVIIDNEDEFTSMLNHILSSLGFRSKVVKNIGQDFEINEHAIVVLGPGPGDPTNLNDARICRLHEIAKSMLSCKQPFLAICLGHQVLSHILGYPIVKVDPPLQGFQKKIKLFGQSQCVGFYNTFFASESSRLPSKSFETSADQDGLINAIKGPHYIGFQFHPECALTPNSREILKAALEWIMKARS